MKNCSDLNLGGSLHTFFLFPDFGLYLLNGYDFDLLHLILIYFEWHETENQQLPVFT